MKNRKNVTIYFFSKGDPDVRGNDGVYSRYFTNFQAGEGRYDIEIHVDNYRGTAYTYQPKIFKGKGTKISSDEPELEFSGSSLAEL